MSQSPIPRRTDRRPVVLAATCRTRSGLRDTAQISDISPFGCRLTTRSLAIKVGAYVVIRPQGLEGLIGIVRWVEGGSAGVEFERPLYEPVVDHLSRLHAVALTVPGTSDPPRH